MPETQGKIGIIRGVSVGSYGQTIQVTLKDLDGNVQDVSSFNATNTVYATSPGKAKDVSATISLVSGGSDGVVSWSWADGDIDRPGDWEVQIVLNSATVRVKSFIGQMSVIPALAEDA